MIIFALIALVACQDEPLQKKNYFCQKEVQYWAGGTSYNNAMIESWNEYDISLEELKAKYHDEEIRDYKGNLTRKTIYSFRKM